MNHLIYVLGPSITLTITVVQRTTFWVRCDVCWINVHGHLRRQNTEQGFVSQQIQGIWNLTTWNPFQENNKIMIFKLDDSVVPPVEAYLSQVVQLQSCVISKKSLISNGNGIRRSGFLVTARKMNKNANCVWTLWFHRSLQMP